MQEEDEVDRIAGRKNSVAGLPWRWTLSIFLAALTGLGFFTSTASLTASLHTNRRALLGNSEHEFIRLACHATSYSEVCISSIEADPRSKNGFSSAYRIIELSVELASQASIESFGLAAGILKRAGSDRNLTSAARDCVQVLGFAINRYKKCLGLFSGTGASGFSVKDLEAWLSSIQAHQYDCFSALGYVNSTKEVQSAMIQAQSGLPLISNALSMANALDKYGLNVSKWQPPPLKRQSSSAADSKAVLSQHKHWKWIQRGESTQKFGISAVVGKDETSDFRSIQQAIDSAPSNSNARYVILIKEGIYNERVIVPESKTMITLLGDGVNKTVITGNNYVQYGVTTMETNTMLVAGDGFIAQNLTITNAAGPEAHQAVALRIDADKVIIQACSLIGYQDTLYSHTLRHYFLDSTIAGTVDFIFGNSAAIFSNCRLIVRQGRAGIYTSMVTAHGRIDPAQTTGFAFHNCVVDAAADFKQLADSNKYKTYLGRPWKMYSRAVFINCFLGKIVAAEGWLAWKGDFALETLMFGEYESHGPGGDDLSRRVVWSTQLNSSQVLDYAVHSFIQGDSWVNR